MDNETINKYARDTLNALITGGYLSKEIIFVECGKVKLDAPLLRCVENILRDYYKADNAHENRLMHRDIV